MLSVVEGSLKDIDSVIQSLEEITFEGKELALKLIQSSRTAHVCYTGEGLDTIPMRSFVRNIDVITTHSKEAQNILKEIIKKAYSLGDKEISFEEAYFRNSEEHINVVFSDDEEDRDYELSVTYAEFMDAYSKLHASK